MIEFGKTLANVIVILSRAKDPRMWAVSLLTPRRSLEARGASKLAAHLAELGSFAGLRMTETWAVL